MVYLKAIKKITPVDVSVMATIDQNGKVPLYQSFFLFTIQCSSPSEPFGFNALFL